MKMDNKRQKILFLILGVFLILFVIDLGWLTGGKSGSISGGGKKPSSANEADMQRNIQADRASYQVRGKIKPLNYSGDWEKDPFYYLTTEELEDHGGLSDIFKGGEVELKITAISIRGTQGMAIINDEVVMAGDKIAGFTVDQIGPNYVILRKGTQTSRIDLGE